MRGLGLKVRKIGGGLRYALYVVTHPIDGFWCAQREGKGSAGAATVIIAAVTIVYMLSRQMTGFIFNENSGKGYNLLSELLGIVVPVVLWCVANWSITTLMDGEGTFKDIYVSTAYALTPVVLVQIPMILLSRLITLDERRLYDALGILLVVWVGLLLFCGLMTIHQYTVTKTIVTVLIALVAMAALLFLFLLFFALIQQLINFLYIFYKEITLRL